MTTTAAPTTCTVGPHAVTGARCGAPAVTTFTTRTGATYAECAAHAYAPATPPATAPGATVTVYHAGVTKTGVVLTVGRTRARVTVPVGRGRTAGTKVITVALAGL